MKEKIEMREDEVEGVEVIDLGDAAVETKQPHPIQQIRDSSFAWTYFAL